MSCQGHEGKCKFCKKEEGAPRSINGMPLVDRITGKKLIDPCCRACASNLRHSKRFYEPTSIS